MAFITSKVQEAGSRNSELLGILAETDHAIPALGQQNRYVEDLDKAITELRMRIESLDKQRVRELKEHEKYRDSVMKRFAYRVSGKTGKFAAKAEKGEREYFAVLEKEHKAKEEAERLEAMRTEALGAQKDLEAVVARHNKAQHDLDSLYDSIFQGPTPGFPEEDLSERNAERALQAYHEARTKMESELQVVRILSQARSCHNNAANYIEEALDHSRIDMFGGGTFSDMMERNALSKADRQVSQMMILVSQAQRRSPHVQSLPPVRIAEGSLVMDVFFDNILSDMDFHEKIKDSRASLQRCGHVLARQLNNAQARYQACEAEVNLNVDALRSARLELQRARERIFERIISGQGGGEQGHATEYTSESPPPYALVS
ncbi:hypothetical protein F4809DRAFT_253024 [Biscogniauxia mediterranea]|nr:hypothetical protein F4809DRAFT_253024 [Biscogniauxia mediterranea]